MPNPWLSINKVAVSKPKPNPLLSNHTHSHRPQHITPEHFASYSIMDEAKRTLEKSLENRPEKQDLLDHNILKCMDFTKDA